MADGQWHLVERHIKVRQYGKVGESEVLDDSTLMQKVSDGGTRKEATDSWSSPARTIVSTTIISTSFLNYCPT